jgi:hypothetical protein
MEHSEFVAKYEAREIKAHVDRNAAGFMYEAPGRLPQSIRKRQAMQRFIAMAGVVGGGISFFWLPWWGAGLIVILFLASFRQIQSSAAEGVLEAALKDASIYDLAIENKVLVVESIDGG